MTTLINHEVLCLAYEKYFLVFSPPTQGISQSSEESAWHYKAIGSIPSIEKKKKYFLKVLNIKTQTSI